MNDLPIPTNDQPMFSTPTQPARGFFDAIPAKTAYWMGIGTGLAITFTVGFFLLLGMYAKGVEFPRKTANGAGANTNQPAPSNPTDTDPSAQQPTAIQVAPVSDSDHIRGDKNAQVTIIEFSDTECPFCKRFHVTMKQLQEAYGGKVSWVYRHFPLDSLHRKAHDEAHATECAAAQGGNDAFWKYIDRLFEITPSNDGLDPAELPKIAQQIGLDVKKFNECQTAKTYAGKIQEQENQGVAAGAQGTPYSVIVSGDQKIPINGALPFDQIKPVLDSLLK
ncbi:thioredoxin domain-containing protein [Candidatus Uhrbacteria bacterium]|nr:thioredoxin domain-containing protein [Candidatus Uhrbacteria bacterium]